MDVNLEECNEHPLQLPASEFKGNSCNTPTYYFCLVSLRDSTQVESETRPVEITSEQGNKSLATVCPTNMMQSSVEFCLLDNTVVKIYGHGPCLKYGLAPMARSTIHL